MSVLFAVLLGWFTGPGWAATVPLRDCGNCIPHRTLAHLPPDGILIQLHAYPEERQFRPPRAAWPLRIRLREVSAGFEGVPARYGVVQRAALVGRREVFLWVWFGRALPSAAQVRRANAMLARAHIR